MKKKYYNNGCSFSYGTRIGEPHQFVWCNQIGEHFEYSVNEAVPAGSNHRAVRRSIEFLSQVDDPTEWVATLQLTNPDRSEFVETNSGYWIGLCGEDSVHDDQAFQNASVDMANQYHLSPHALAARMLTRTETANMIETLMLVHAYKSFCESRGVEYLITAMSSRCMPLRFLENSKYIEDNPFEPNLITIQGLIDSLPQERFTHTISEIVQPHVLIPGKDLHPNKKGHTIFARYIHSVMKRMKWIGDQ